MTTNLTSIQTTLSDFLLGHDNATAITSLVRGAVTGSLSTLDRLQIYHHAYRARLLEALRDSFEHTWAYLGDENFDLVASNYIETTRSKDPNIRWYGATFPTYLAKQYSDDLEIAELAELDWTLRLAFDAQDAEILSVAALQTVTEEQWEHIKIKFHPSVHLLRQHHNTLAIWHAIDSGTTPPPVQYHADIINLVVWRRDVQPHFMSLESNEATALRQLRNGMSFASVCEQFALIDPDTVNHMGQFLRRWLDHGMINAFTEK